MFLRVFAKRISKRIWMAWFEDWPQLSAGGSEPRNAIENLLQLVRNNGLDINKMKSVCKWRQTDQMEFEIPLLDRYADIVAASTLFAGIPKPSHN